VLANRWVWLAAVLAAGLGACAGTRRVAGGGEAAAPVVAPVAPAPVVAAPVAPAPVVEPEPVPPPAVDSAALDAALRPALVDPGRAGDRRQQFARAVARISSQLGVPITVEQALREMPCGGWSGPDCTNLTVGIEIAKACAPVIASFHRKRTAEIATLLVDAVSVHAIWHDAYGYVRRVKKKGPGYTYAGCLFSKCEPDDLENGQVDGVLYQIGRLLGTLTGPACGPDCALTD